MPSFAVHRLAGRTALVLLALCLFSISGCADEYAAKEKDKQAARPGDAPHQLIVGYSLLFDLVHSEQDVDQILKIKSVSAATDALIKRIAQESRNAVDGLERLKGLAPTLNLEDVDLPLVERAARKSIAVKTAIDLVISMDSFEVRLLLTQAQALRYGTYLSRELAGIDPNKKRRKWLGVFAKQCEDLYGKVISRLRVADQPGPGKPKPKP